MKDAEGNTIDVKVPFSLTEKNRFSRFLKANGLKKGAFVRMAILERLSKEERRTKEEAPGA